LIFCKRKGITDLEFSEKSPVLAIADIIAVGLSLSVEDFLHPKG
jgi:hypothetical protein